MNIIFIILKNSSKSTVLVEVSKSEKLTKFNTIWIFSMSIFGNWSDSKESVLPIYHKLIDAGLKIWVYRYYITISYSHILHIINWDLTKL